MAHTHSESGIGTRNFIYSDKTGTDGKYELYNGRLRLKWNTYHVFYQHQIAGLTSTGYSVGAATGIKNINLIFNNTEYNQVLDKLATKVKDHSFNLAVNIAQGKQAVNMVVDTLTSFGHAVRSARRGDFISAIYILKASPRGKRKFVSKDISGRWLELQYGWLPMVSDCYEAIKAFADSNQSRRNVTSASSKKVYAYAGSDEPSNYASPGIGKARYIVRYEQEEDFSFARSLGLADPLSVAWEILPWSFVIDWFLPIGTFLSNLAVIPFLKGRFSDSLTNSQNAECKGTIDPIHFGTGGFAKSHFFEYVRGVPGGTPRVPFPSFVPFSKALSPKRVYNAMALAHQRFKA